MKTTYIFALVCLLAGSAFATPMELNTRDLATCKACMTTKLHAVGITYGTTYIGVADMHKWSTAGATCSLEGKCAKGAPVSSSGSGSDSGGDHKPTHKPSDVMQLAKQLRAAKKMIKQEGGASDESS